MKKKITTLIIAISCILTITGCGKNSVTNTDFETQVEMNVDVQVNDAVETIENMKGEDFENVEVSENTATKINLKDSIIEIDGKGASVNGNVVNIITAGDYYISGTLNDGQIVIDAENSNVTLVLNNATIKSSATSPIYVKAAKNVIIKTNSGTENYIEDATTYVYKDSSETEPDAAIFSKSDLYITGTGKLTVKGNYNDAIKSKDDFSILSGTVVVDSVDDGIVGKDSVSLKNCIVTVNAGGDGIKSTNDEDVTRGYVAIESGTFNITAVSDGIQAETDINIAGGTFNITTGGGSTVSSTSNNSSDMMNFGGGRRWGQWETTLDKEDTQSAKAIKAVNNLTIMGGNFNIDSSDDSIHCNNNIVVSGGTIKAAAGDDGIHADNILNITGGKISILKSYEGLEASSISISSGTIDIVASDDGINVAGGNDGSSMDGRMGQNTFSSSNNCILTIESGSIKINAAGDGLDANGSIYIKGGEVIVAGPTNSGNGALDYARECVVTGGTLLAYGASGMAQSPSSNSTQNTICINGSYNAGDKLEIKNGTEAIYTIMLEKSCQSIVLSSSLLKDNNTYTLYVNEVEGENVTISSNITNVGGKSSSMGNMNDFSNKGGKNSNRQMTDNAIPNDLEMMSGDYKKEMKKMR